MGNNWNDIFNGLLFLSPLCYTNPASAGRGGLVGRFVPGLRLGEVGSEVSGCQRTFLSTENGFCAGKVELLF